ncbi:phage/plasmid primase, P4 family [Acinetobacter modestus]|uniref:phage/plasmid primase, P4 family n=1 Tax=Acinetobacter modestus TaxID=1776740 RepID=UPI001F4B455D|nr:phage/plasmid primase, P4 family [Acinetobacter modestus]MCH7334692.1 phage/plasmid primase, P4 family [Acinetobacter modestus]
MTDCISVLRHSTIQLAKTWQNDGNISAYQDAKYFSLVEKPVSNIQDLSKILAELEHDSRACVIRGIYKGDEHAQKIDPEFKQGKVRRQKRLFEDKPHHWVLIEIDDFEPMLADPVREPVETINEYIATCLPACFHEVSYYWQLSNSAGHLKHIGKLKAHVWFWLETVYTSDQLKTWAEQNNIALDNSVLNTVQIHYTATPVFEAGVSDPVPIRSGYFQGLIGDEVDLKIVLDLGSARKSSTVETEHDFDDPFAGIEPKVGLTLTDAQSLIKFIDSSDYQTWLKAGMALHHEFDGSDEALSLWNDWSSIASNYQSFDDLKYRWDNFAQGGQNPITCRWLKKFGEEATKSAEHQEMRESMDEIKNLILECNDGVVLINDIAKKAGNTASGDIAMLTELTGLIKTRFKQLTNTTISASDLRIAMSGAKARTSPLNTDGRHYNTELGNVNRMMDAYQDLLMYAPEINTWYQWNGCFWDKGTGVEVFQLATQIVIDLPKEASQIKSDAERADFLIFCANSQRGQMVKSMVDFASKDERVVVSVQSLDQDNNLLGCNNGVIDLTTGELLPPSQDYRITYSTGVVYNGKAKCPVFEQTVSDVFNGDAEMIAFFQRIIGYIALGNPSEQLIVIPYGSGANGKSTVFGAIRSALGNYSRTTPSETFLTQGGKSSAGGAREDLLRLRGARFVYSSEPNEGCELREDLIKSTTGGEKIAARGLYAKHSIEFLPTWTVVMPTNHKPIIKGEDHGIWRRILLIPFTRNFDKDPVKKDPNRPAKLQAELPGILRWIVDGALAYQRGGLNRPMQVIKAGEEYKKENDLLVDWLEDCCELVNGYRESNKNLWQSWQAWAIANGRQNMFKGERGLGKKLSSKFEKWRTENGRGYVGVRVVELTDFADLIKQ